MGIVCDTREFDNGAGKILSGSLLAFADLVKAPVAHKKKQLLFVTVTKWYQLVCLAGMRVCIALVQQPTSATGENSADWLVLLAGAETCLQHQAMDKSGIFRTLHKTGSLSMVQLALLDTVSVSLERLNQELILPSAGASAGFQICRQRCSLC